jgi:hypothetical protein
MDGFPPNLVHWAPNTGTVFLVAMDSMAMKSTLMAIRQGQGVPEKSTFGLPQKKEKQKSIFIQLNPIKKKHFNPISTAPILFPAIPESLSDLSKKPKISTR